MHEIKVKNEIFVSSLYSSSSIIDVISPASIFPFIPNSKLQYGVSLHCGKILNKLDYANWTEELEIQRIRMNTIMCIESHIDNKQIVSIYCAFQVVQK